MGRLERKNSQSSSTDNEKPEMKRENPNDDNFLEEENSARVSALKDPSSSTSPIPPSATRSNHNNARSPSSTIPKQESDPQSPKVKTEIMDTNGQLSTKAPPIVPTKTRGMSKKNIPRIAPSFEHLPDATSEANGGYQVIDACIYQNKFLGYTEHAMECDCNEEWDPITKINDACGEDSDCINRATKMECVGDCTCGPACQNQRFGRRLYANVSVIKTEKKGYGLRTNVPLKNGDFIFEYIGEVIPEGTFRKRMRSYDDEGIKHFYFMSLSKGEFVDATKKGNLGRFCNHSCNPNCYVDKWVVGDKLRMGIFAERTIKAGEELVFNYNVDRYGANPQPCYCGESNCTGFIGGKTQTERATKLSAATIEALGIDEDDWDTWDTVVAKRPKKKKTAEDDDEDYVERAEAKSLDVQGVTKVMAALMQCKEKWIAVKLLQRMQRCEEEIVLHRIIQLHGYKILNSQLSAWREDENVILQILDILDKFPRLTRNKIVDAKIDKTLEPLKDSQDERVASKSVALLEGWSKLELAYRIPRKARTVQEGSHQSTPVKFERRESQQQRKRSRSRSKSPPKGPSGVAIPTGPRSTARPAAFGGRPTVPFVRGPPPLPVGWFTASDASGRSYFYSASGETTWKRPSRPAAQPPPPSKQASQQDILKDIINDIVTLKEKDTKTTTPDTPEPSKVKEKKEEKWRSYDEEKKKKLYENTLFPHIAHVMNKYKHKIPKDDLKRFAKDLAKKLVNSDFKAGRVEDPTKISEKQQKKVKSYCKEYFDKAAEKHKKYEAERTARKVKKEGRDQIDKHIISTAPTPSQSPGVAQTTPKKEEDSGDEDIKMSDIEDEKEDASPIDASHNGTLKRKRSIESTEPVIKDEDDQITKSPLKRMHIDSENALPTPPPPPPPAPPAESPPEAGTPAEDTENQQDPDDVAVPMDTDIHADTNFRGKSMADVLAQAQQEEDEVDWGMDDIDDNKETTTRFEQNVDENGVKLENPLVEGQVIVEQIKQEQES